ncbi:cobalamin synthesis protein P47K [Desulfovibrio sp. X2]|uniref:GTP-binding protein n=1 Tax=Desulfovibrio sp. X2 TaxID=941449 RepID=UPI000358ED2F|nr:GTP-binding protein [Desulfovibrio sp. X2]EPR37029.1 cobalamin synthesis protein P47K [Desulfovibrio sp. X2]
MRLVTVAGPPSSGKTAVLIKSLEHLRREGLSAAVVKFDCISSRDREAFVRAGIPAVVGLSGGLCPDHFYVSNVQDALAWGRAEGLDLLLFESAGLCNRCAPHITGVLAVCVVDNLSGVHTPQKIGPMLKLADVVVVTKGDIVSQAEREVFLFRVRQVNPRATALTLNGLTGQGARALASLLSGAPVTESLDGATLRFSMPAAVCSYCLGQRRVGQDFQMGNVRKMRFEKIAQEAPVPGEDA